MSLLFKAIKTLFREGPFIFIKKFFGFLKRKWYGAPLAINPTYYNYITDLARPPLNLKKMDQRYRKDNPEKMVINWVIPDLDLGSGGHTTIFRIIDYLEKFGHKNRIYIFGGTKHGRKIGRFIRKNYFNLSAEIYPDILDIKDSDCLVATGWWTAYPVKQIQNARKKFYFVQDFEPSFYPMGSEYQFAENTYQFGFYGICAGKWLPKILKEKYSMEADWFNLAYDPEIYKIQDNLNEDNLILKSQTHNSKNYSPVTLKKNNKFKIAHYIKPGAPRRGFELGVQAFRELYRRGLEFELIFFGWDAVPYIIPFPYRNLKVLGHRDLAKLYNWADLGVVFSLTNYSIIPQEMMACGLPVVELKVPSIEAIFEDEKNIFLAEPEPLKIADKIEELMGDSQRRKKTAQQALEYVKNITWEKSAKKVEEILKRELNHESIQISANNH